MLEINKGKQTTLFSSASILCISCVNRSASLGSRGRKQFLLLAMRNLGRSNAGHRSWLWRDRGGTSARLGRQSTRKRAALWSDNSTASLLLLDCTCCLHPQDSFLLSRKVLLNSWINWKCSHLSLSWTGLNTHSFALNPSLKHTIKSNTFLVNKLINKQFYSRATYQNYLVNKTSMFTLNIGQLLGRISDPYSSRATPQTPKWNLTHRCTFNDNGFFLNTRTLASLTLQLSSSK